MPLDRHERLLPCPGIELFLDSRGDLYLLPIRDREQLRIAAPWGRRAWHALRGEPVGELDPEEAVELAGVLDWLEAQTYARRASAVMDPRWELWDRQVRWFAQEAGDGPSCQRRLADSTVVVLGVGGLGCLVADLLARAGVGRLVLVDDDVVEPTNLPRQLLYGSGDEGRAKVLAARRRIEGAVPGSLVIPVHRAVSGARDVAALFAEYDPQLVMCAADRPPVSIKGWVEDAATAYGVAVMHGGHRPPYTYAGPFYVPGESACYECFARSRMEPGTEQLEAELRIARDRDCPELPAVAWGDAAAASMVVGQCVQWLAGMGAPTLYGREFELDLRSFGTRFIEAAGEPCCERCSPRRMAA
jgi:molybdopterin/thiamine biosynthesis adenylyltransferase